MANPLIQALEEQAACAPAAIWLSDRQAAWQSTAVLAEARALASRLVKSRVVAVLADNGPAWVIADLASQIAGKPHLPLPGFFAPAQLAHALGRSGADLILTDQPERIGALDLGFGITGAWQGMTMMRRVAEPARLPIGTAKISFTSGSTGAPKGVCLSAEGLFDTAAALIERLADLPVGRHLAALPLGLLLENVAGVYAPLLRGADVHLPPLRELGWSGMAGFDPAALHARVEELRPDSLILVPELLKAWTLYLAATAQRAPDSLDYVAVGGARVDASLLERARALGLPAYQGYGLTECGSVVSLNRPGDDGPGVGRPLAHVRIRVEKAEVRVRARAFLGYLDGQPLLPEWDGSCEFATGDLGEVDAHGRLALSGRRKNLLITSFGRNLSPEWIESALLAQPAVAQAVVAGDDRPHPCAVLVPRAGTGTEEIARAVAAANAALPDYARVGGWLAVPPFTTLNGLATGNGRPVRSAILEHFAADLAALYNRKEIPNALL